MRQFYAFSLLSLAVGLAHSAHAQQPFERFGMKVKVATLSNGRYPEFFRNDSLRRIGSVVYNTRLRRIAYLLPGDSLVGRAKPEVTSRWFSPDPLAEKYLSISPYVYAADNPIRYADHDGREIVDSNGKHVAVSYHKDGTLGFSKNASADVRRIATALNGATDGRAQLHNLTGSRTKVHLDISEKTVSTASSTTNGETIQGNNNAKDNYGKVQNADGTLGLKEASITVYEGSLKQGVQAGSGSKLEGLTVDQAVAAVVGHEIVHAVDKGEVNKDLQYEQKNGGQPRPYDQREGKPNRVEQKIIDQFRAQ